VLIARTLPNPKRAADYTLEFIRYHQRRNYQAYRSHRKRRILELKKWKNLKVSL